MKQENNNNPRRSFLKKLTVLLSGSAALPAWSSLKNNTTTESNKEMIKNIKPLGFQWDTQDPFLFCVHHEDAFPAGDGKLGVATEQLEGRHLGDDFIIKDGFRMYHGKHVPGFPGHPHRGFETVTVVRKGIVDHLDSLGAAGRYGNGDVQWMTAGKGVQHAEMFPLVHADKENPLELFQIWLNLPKADKMVEPHFKMLWKESMTLLEHTDEQENTTKVEIIAGTLNGKKALAPPPNSWAAKEENHVGIWNIKMPKNATFSLPKTEAGINRTLYFYEGDKLQVGTTEISKYSAIEVEPDMDIPLKTFDDEVSILVLQGKPINEPVMQYGPFVMNTKEEIMQAFNDYHQTQFGGWPWDAPDQTHPADKKRFARHADGTEEIKENLG